MVPGETVTICGHHLHPCSVDPPENSVQYRSGVVPRHGEGRLADHLRQSLGIQPVYLTQIYRQAAQLIRHGRKILGRHTGQRISPFTAFRLAQAPRQAQAIIGHFDGQFRIGPFARDLRKGSGRHGDASHLVNRGRHPGADRKIQIRGSQRQTVLFGYQENIGQHRQSRLTRHGIENYVDSAPEFTPGY